MQPADKPDNPGLRYVIASRPDAVRKTLAAARDTLRDLGLTSESLGTCELVLAEALNNIVEHAYAENSDGTICLGLTVADKRLQVRIEDHGFAMPGGALPQGDLGTLAVPTEDLPEGGFGWFLIRSMTEELRYRRKDGVNFLDFTIALDDSR